MIEKPNGFIIDTFVGILVKTHIAVVKVFVGVDATDVLSRWDHLVEQDAIASLRVVHTRV